MCVCVCNVSVVCVEIYYFKSSCLPYIQCMHLFHLAIVAVFCVLSYCAQFCLCMSQVFLCACMECNIPVWWCEFVPVCTCVPVCTASCTAQVFLYGCMDYNNPSWSFVSVCAQHDVYHRCFVCLHGLQYSSLVVSVCICVCAHYVVYIADVSLLLPAWIAIFQFSCLCLRALCAPSFQIQFSCVCVRACFQLNRCSVSVAKHTPRYKRTQVCFVPFYFHPECRIVLPSIHSRSGKMGHSL